MKILIVTPAPSGSRKGNRITAERWAHLLRPRFGVSVAERYYGQPCDAMIALHARKSATSICRFREDRPHAPLVVALTGTDLYRDLMHANWLAQRSVELADRLIVLQPEALRQVPVRQRRKCRVVIQSAARVAAPVKARRWVFEIGVIAHLRAVKDPFRAAFAARQLPADSRIRIIHVGGALSQAMQHRAQRETERNPRYRWLGELPHQRTVRLLARCRVMVVSSRSEGGANVVSEAIVNGVPILASRIPGNVGLLGRDYAGLFPVGNTHALARLMLRAENDPAYLQCLQGQLALRAWQFTPQHEAETLRQVMLECTSP